MINGLILSEEYFSQRGLPMIENEFQNYKGRIAAGLVGEGSECYGFDDEISKDHDWGPGFCIWLTQEDFYEIGAKLQSAYCDLPDSFSGYSTKSKNPICSDRIGVLSISGFYDRLIGIDHVPESLDEWRAIPEQSLSIATNGKVFYDPLGSFTSFRKSLISYYPEDVRLKKIAARCMIVAQTGQYNYTRCIQHEETAAAQYALSLFADSAISLIFLLNKKYKPFYKWMYKALKTLPILGADIHTRLTALVSEQNIHMADRVHYNVNIIEDICQMIICELLNQGLTDIRSDFLFDHGPSIQAKIHDDKIRNLNVMAD